MIPLSAEFVAWKNSVSRAPLLVLLAFEIAPGIVHRVVMGDPTGTGAVIYDGETYTAASVIIGDIDQNLRGDFPAFDLQVSNINGVAGGLIETYDISGQQVEISILQLKTVRDAA